MRVLLVEDEKDLARYVRKGLEEEGYAVDCSADGSEALDAACGVAYDVVLLDVMIPSMSGVEVCSSMRARGLSTPVIMLTALDSIESRISGLDSGADDYVVKPFVFEELLARIRAVTRRSRDIPRSSVLSVADLRLDTVTKKASRGDLVIEFPAKEYALLECLMREPERVFSRQQIADRLWDSSSYTESNVVDVYIRNLRRKIDDPFSIKLICTVKGMGYKISARGEHETAP